MAQTPRRPSPFQKGKGSGLYFGIFLLIVALLFFLFSRRKNSVETLSYTEFLDRVSAGQVASVEIDEDRIRGLYKFQSASSVTITSNGMGSNATQTASNAVITSNTPVASRQAAPVAAPKPGFLQGLWQRLSGTDAQSFLPEGVQVATVYGFQTVMPMTDPLLLTQLRVNGVVVTGVPQSKKGGEASFFIWALFIGLGIFIFWMLSGRGSQGGGGPGQAMSFGRSRARMYRQENAVAITFNDVAGCEEAKDELLAIVDFLKRPKRFVELGARIPKGVLLAGNPGTGKTLLARAVAGEAGVAFLSASASEFVEMFVGVGASRVRDLFEQGRKHAPCIIFIDELDAVGRARGTGTGGGNDEREQTLNQILVEMDGFDNTGGVIVLAATNRVDVLDQALLRKGRFDSTIFVDLPDVHAREAILRVHARQVPLEDSVDLSVIARSTPGMTGADLASVVNEAALRAGHSGRKQVVMQDFIEAREKVQMGPERRSLVLSEEDKLTTAYHEAGHTIVGYFLEYVDPVHKVTIIPRGPALGVTYFLPPDDRRSYIKKPVKQQLAMMLAGRAAEELMFGAEFISAGASSDIQRVTEFAHSMVRLWGMSDQLGLIRYNYNESNAFFYSDETRERIDFDVRSIVDAAYALALSTLRAHEEELIELAERLLERETMGSQEIQEILGPEPFDQHPILAVFRKKLPRRYQEPAPREPSPFAKKSDIDDPETPMPMGEA